MCFLLLICMHLRNTKSYAIILDLIYSKKAYSKTAGSVKKKQKTF